jgi:hypothetical protein
MKKTDGLALVIRQFKRDLHGREYQDDFPEALADNIRTYLKEVLPKGIDDIVLPFPLTDYESGWNDCLKSANQALGLTE